MRQVPNVTQKKKKVHSKISPVGVFLTLLSIPFLFFVVSLPICQSPAAHHRRSAAAFPRFSATPAHAQAKAERFSPLSALWAAQAQSVAVCHRCAGLYA